MQRLVSIPWSTFFGSLFMMLTIAGLIGNMVVIIAISGDVKMRKSVMNMLLLNLAIADFLNLITTTVEWTHTIVLGYPAWVFPDILCPIARYFECVFLFTSILTQLTVCVERYIAIVYPIHARRLCSRTNIMLIIFVIWSFVSILALPYALFHQKRPSSRVCGNSRSSSPFWVSYKWVEFLSFYFVPCIIFVVLYSKVCCVLWAKNRQLYEEHSSSCELNARSDALAMRRSVVKMLVVCVSIYFICYSPIQAIFLSKVLFNVSLHPPYEFILLMNALAMTCSACNPLLYTLFSKRFRVRITRLLGCGGKSASAESVFNGRTYEITYSFSKQLPEKPLRTSVLYEKELYPSQNTIMRSI
ncbi:7 transmembrane receptor (rhodopsin family) domain-containing protein [Ditylenchus destructor]|nr:7 transmembrane receptor (rhodopsin family) domain-containing protein [Ditylenchus destructor]